MKQRFALVLIFALVVSAAASVVLYRLIANQISSNKEAAQSKVLVAARNLASGDLIKEGDVKLADWSGTAPQGAMTKVEDAVGRGAGLCRACARARRRDRSRPPRAREADRDGVAAREHAREPAQIGRAHV